MHDEIDPAPEDVEGHRLASNDNEVVVRPTETAAQPNDEDDDVEGHRLAANDNEIVVSPAPPPDVDTPRG